MTDTEHNSKTGWIHRGNRKLIAVVTATTLLAGGAFGVQAIADTRTYAHLKLYAADAGGIETVGWGGGPWGWRGHRGRWSNLSDAEVEERVVRIVKHVAIEIDATPAQQETIAGLVTAAVKDIRPVRKDMRAAFKKLRTLLVAETIDREAIEALRSERLADIDRISKTLARTAADVAEVLTPRQRELFEERIDEFRSMRRGWWRRG